MATRKPKPCNHKLDKYVWRADRAVARVCATPREDGVFGCGAVLPLGPSDNAAAEVQIEIRAVDLESAKRAGEWPEVAEEFETAGWLDHADGVTAAGTDLGSLAGWLARQIYPAHVAHDAEGLAGEDWPADLITRIAPTHPAIAAAQEAARTAELDAMECEVTRDGDPDPRDDDEPELAVDGIDQAEPEPMPEVALAEQVDIHDAPTDVAAPLVAVADDLAGAARTLNADLAVADQPARSWPPNTGCDPDAIDPLEPTQDLGGSDGAES